jgi:hypothetical protein
MLWDANPWICTSSNITTLSTYGSTIIFDDESSGLFPKLCSVLRHSESDRFILEDNSCLLPTLSCSPAASTAASASSTSSYTLVEDTSSNDGNSLQSPVTHNRYAGLLTTAGDEREEWSDDDTITIAYSQNETAQTPDIATLAAKSNAQIKD